MPGRSLCTASATTLALGAAALAVACGAAGGGDSKAPSAAGSSLDSGSANDGSIGQGDDPPDASVGSTGSPDGSTGVAAWCSTHGSSSPSSGDGGLVFTIDLCKGPARQTQPPTTPAPVSPYVYGINAGSFVATPTKWGVLRQGGDNDTAYNWTNDYTNSGADYCYLQGAATPNANLAGRYTDPTGDTIPAALAKGEAFLVTVPVLDYVSAAYGRNTGWDSATNASDVCPGTDPVCSARSGSDHANVVDKFQGDPNFNSTLTFAYANDGTSTTTGSPAFVANTMSKGSAFCSCPAGTRTCSGCTVGTSPVAQDEFVNFLKVNYGTGGAPVFFDLDNEPNYWVGNHPEIYPNKCSTGSVPWDDVATRDLKAAKAIKSAWPTAKVFGPVVSGDGMAYGGDYQSPHFVAGTTEFSDWYLQQTAAASVTAASPQLDVFDVHYYTTGTTDAQCLEAPRLFWDPNATDISAADTNALDFNYGDHSYWDQYWYPREVVPRLFGKIAAAYAGKSTAAPALSFSEYNAGCETAISGGVAEADLLGIFGREGVFAAMAWPLQSSATSYLVAAYDLYRNYDGKGAVVGDTAVRSVTSDPKNTSVYAYTQGGDVTSLQVVAINKQSAAQTVTLQISSAPSYQSATLYHLVTGSAAVKAVTGTAPTVTCASDTCTLTFSMPSTSATTVVLR